MTKTWKKLSLLAVLAALVVAGLLVLLFKDDPNSRSTPTPPPPAPAPSTKSTTTSESSFLLNEVFYACSRPIEGQWEEAQVGHTRESGRYFRPASQEDLRRYCREEAVIEYHAILEVLKKPDVARTISTYNTTEAWVKALNAIYIKDKDFMRRILPDYAAMDIHCVIVVHSPEGTRYFLEDGSKVNEYVEVPAAVFLASLNRASDADVTSFWLGLH